jgi:hypothetical protein
MKCLVPILDGSNRLEKMERLKLFADHPVFVCGHPKSGTTLVRALLDNHPELVVFPEETAFFRTIYPIVRDRKPTVGNLTLVRRLLLRSLDEVPVPEIIEENSKAFPSNVQAKDYAYLLMHYRAEELLKKVGNRHYGDSLCAAVLAYGQVYQKIGDRTKYWVEKTPHNEQFVDIIFNWWPEARCIHVVRDPRDNYTAYSRKRSEMELFEFAEFWQASLRAGVQNLAAIGGERYLLIRYEDLLTSPEEMISKIVRFLQISDDPNLRYPTKGGKIWEGNSMFADKFSAISTAPIGRYKKGLSKKEVIRLETFLFDEMAEIGYERDESFSIAAKFQGKIYLLIERLKRTWHTWRKSVPEIIRN